MLQTNVSGSPLILTTLTPPVEVPPGGVIDYPDRLAGFTPVVEPEPDPEPKTAPRTSRKAASPAADTKEGTQ